MKPQTCCCHVCKTSLNQYKREFLPCTKCNKIVCRPCFGTKFKGMTWEESLASKDTWVCPSCLGTCTCPRCKKKPKIGYGSMSLIDEDEFKFSSHHGHQQYSPSLMQHSSSFEDLVDMSSALSDRERREKMHREQTKALEKLKPNIQKIVVDQLNDLVERERRCETNVREMEKLLIYMKREKEEIQHEKGKLEKLVGLELLV